MTCDHKRYVKVSAKAFRRQEYQVPHIGLRKKGYAPRIPGVALGKYIDIRICLDCCKVIDMRPMDDEELVEAFSS